MNVTGKVSGLVFMALAVFFLIKYVFPLVGAVVGFLKTLLQHFGVFFPV